MTYIYIYIFNTPYLFLNTSAGDEEFGSKDNAQNRGAGTCSDEANIGRLGAQWRPQRSSITSTTEELDRRGARPPRSQRSSTVSTTNSLASVTRQTQEQTAIPRVAPSLHTVKREINNSVPCSSSSSRITSHLALSVKYEFSVSCSSASSQIT